MVYIRIEAREWSILVPLTLDGIEVAMKFLELLDKMLTETEAQDG